MAAWRDTAMVILLSLRALTGCLQVSSERSISITQAGFGLLPPKEAWPALIIPRPSTYSSSDTRLPTGYQAIRLLVSMTINGGAYTSEPAEVSIFLDPRSLTYGSSHTP